MFNSSRNNTNCKGFTLPELMFSFLLLSICVLGILQLSAALARMDRDAKVESRLFNEAAVVMERIEKGENGLFGLMKAKADSINIIEDAMTLQPNQVEFSVDKNDSYTSSTADDVTMALYFDNGDGDDNTYADNTVMLDVNTNVVGTDIVLGTSVESVSFENTDGLITIDLVIAETVGNDLIRVNTSRDIYLRN